MFQTRTVFVIDYLFDQERRKSDKAGPRALAQKLRQQGKLVQEIYAFCVVDAILQIMRDSVRQVDLNMKVDLLRFYGHGTYGVQNVGGNRNLSQVETLLAVRNGKLLHQSSLRLLQSLMTATSRVELHGCKVGGGQGGELLVRMANVLGVEISAAAVNQVSVSARNASQFEGAVYYARPGMTAAQLKWFN
jgi:hypothetical protein